jgi:hypothetical protein
MKVGRNSPWTTAAFAFVLMMGVASTPAAGAKDLRAVLFNWMWHQGMLKGADERDMVATLEYQAKGGTIQVDGSWQYAWNEDTRGAEIGGTKGKVAAMPATVQERLIRRNAGADAGLIPERGNCETTFETDAAASQIRH